jgi:hypothetical protein
MTRITDFGRKRTHVQAGFPDDSEPAQEPTEPHASTSTLPSESQPHDQVPPKKKRKRTKKPKENGDEGGEKAGPSEDKAQDTVNSEAAKVVPKKKLKDKRKPKSRSFAVNNYSCTERLQLGQILLNVPNRDARNELRRNTQTLLVLHVVQKGILQETVQPYVMKPVVVVVVWRDKKLLEYVIVAVQISILFRDAGPQKTLIILFRLHHASCVLVRVTWHHLVHKTRTRVSIQMEAVANSVAKHHIWPKTAD